MLKETSQALELQRSHRKHHIEPLTRFRVGEFTVSAFPGHHDVSVLGFQIEAGGEKLVYITDTAWVDYNFNSVTHFMLEANYDPNSLEKSGNNPGAIRRIVRSHMGLENVLKILEDNDLSKLKEVRLCHLSDSNSDEEFILDEVEKVVPDDVIVKVAKR